jgi:hypothetical protein
MMRPELPTILDFSLKYVAVPHHGSLSLYTKLEGASIAKLVFFPPWYGLWMIFKSLRFFMVMAFGPCGKWPLLLYLLSINERGEPTVALFCLISVGAKFMWVGNLCGPL